MLGLAKAQSILAIGSRHHAQLSGMVHIMVSAKSCDLVLVTKGQYAPSQKGTRVAETPIQVDGVDYSPEGIEALRQDMIQHRDAALGMNEFNYAVTMSHVIALLAYLVEVRKAMLKK